MAVTLKGQAAVYEGVSTDTKPTDADNNAIFKELDTGIRYYYDGTDWNEIPSSGGGGGGTGTDNYNELNNKPSINGTVLSGNKSLDNLGIQAKLTFDSAPTEDSENPVESGGVYNALSGKQDTISDLSTIRSGAAAGATAVQPAALETALAQKQDALSSEQLDAVNSGITSADVDQIQKNKNNILIEEITSEITVASGFTKLSTTRVYKQGKHIFGTLIFEKSSGSYPTTGGDIVGTMGNYAPVAQWLGCGFFSDSVWVLKNCGYAFIQNAYGQGDAGQIIVTDGAGGTNKVVKIQIDYVMP